MIYYVCRCKQYMSYTGPGSIYTHYIYIFIWYTMYADVNNICKHDVDIDIWPQGLWLFNISDCWHLAPGWVEQIHRLQPRTVKHATSMYVHIYIYVSLYILCRYIILYMIYCIFPEALRSLRCGRLEFCVHGWSQASFISPSPYNVYIYIYT